MGIRWKIVLTFNANAENGDYKFCTWIFQIFFIITRVFWFFVCWFESIFFLSLTQNEPKTNHLQKFSASLFSHQLLNMLKPTGYKFWLTLLEIFLFDSISLKKFLDNFNGLQMHLLATFFCSLIKFQFANWMSEKYDCQKDLKRTFEDNNGMTKCLVDAYLKGKRTNCCSKKFANSSNTCRHTTIFTIMYIWEFNWIFFSSFIQTDKFWSGFNVLRKLFITIAMLWPINFSKKSQFCFS
jgi:hypothetical protein